MGTLESTGMLALANCLLALLPQVHKVPSFFTATVKFSPAATSLQSLAVPIRTGVFWDVVFPIPNWPVELYPQPQSEPSDAMAITNWNPQEKVFHVPVPMRTGAVDEVTAPRPSTPLFPFPHDHRDPSVCNPMVNNAPALMVFQFRLVPI